MKTFDTIIIGGSCGGAAAAHTLATAGKNVAVFDMATFPREKLCGGMITEKNIKLLQRVYRHIDLSRVVDSSFDSFEVHHSALGRIRRFAHPSQKLYFVDRSIFDAYFLNQAKIAGATIFEGTGISEVTPNHVTLVSGEKMKSTYIIGADGANSVTRKAVVGRYTRKEHFALALEIDLTEKDMNCFTGGSPVPQIHFGVLEHGYAWIFPKSNKITVGLGGLVAKNQENMKDILLRFLETISRPGTESFEERIRSFTVPFQNFIERPANDNIFLVGDAAGFVEPITGEGIYFAVLSGYMAANAILSNNKPEKEYNQMVKLHINKIFKQAYIVKRLFFWPPILRLAMRKMQKNERYGRYYFDLLSGDIDYWGYMKRVVSGRNKQ